MNRRRRFKAKRIRRMNKLERIMRNETNELVKYRKHVFKIWAHEAHMGK